MKRLPLALGILTLAVAAWAEPATPSATPAAIDRLQALTENIALGASASNPAVAKASGNMIFDSQSAAVSAVQAPAPKPVTPPAQTAPAQPGAPAAGGITYPKDDGSGDGSNTGDPTSQIGDMISKALLTPQVTQAIDKVREDQTKKIFSTPVKIGIGVAGAGLVTAGIGLAIGASAVTGVGLAVLGAALLGAALFGLFSK